MPTAPHISESEWEIMKICWGRPQVSAQEVVDHLAAQDNWHPRTVKTLLNRLVKKGALGFEKSGRAYLYHPLVAERDCVAAESRSFINRVFGGSLRPMLAHFVEHHKMSRRELEDLKALLQRKEKP